MISRVMKFGVLRFHSGLDTLERQSKLGHEYYNRLLRLELDRREKYREVRAEFMPTLDATLVEIDRLTGAIDAVYEEIKKGRSDVSKPPNAPKRVAATPAQKLQVADLRAARKVLIDQSKALKKDFEGGMAAAHQVFKGRIGEGGPRIIERRKQEVLAEMLVEDFPEAWKRIATLDAAFSVTQKKLRADSGLTHGTYISVENAVQQAFETADGLPFFKKWENGRGRRKVGLQVRDGGVSALSLDSDSSTQIRFLSRRPNRPGSKGNRARHECVEVVIRLGKEQPAIRFDVVLHRPIPNDAVVRWAYLVHSGGKWTLQLTLNLEKPLIERAPGKGTVEVDFKWSLDKEQQTLIVATVNGDPVRLPPRIISGIEHARGIRSASDQIFNGALEWFRGWLTDNEAPAWMLTENERGRTPLTGIAQWRAHEKLQYVARKWVEEAGGFEAVWETWKGEQLAKKALGASHDEYDLFCHPGHWFNWCEAKGIDLKLWAPYFLGIWLEKDLHLKAYETGTMRRSLLHRREVYLVLAAKLCTQYQHVTFGALDLKKAAKRQAPDKEGEELHLLARRQRVMAGCSELQDAITKAFGKDRVGKAQEIAAE